MATSIFVMLLLLLSTDLAFTDPALFSSESRGAKLESCGSCRAASISAKWLGSGEGNTGSSHWMTSGEVPFDPVMEVERRGSANDTCGGRPGGSAVAKRGDPERIKVVGFSFDKEVAGALSSVRLPDRCRSTAVVEVMVEEALVMLAESGRLGSFDASPFAPLGGLASVPTSGSAAGSWTGRVRGDKLGGGALGRSVGSADCGTSSVSPLEGSCSRSGSGSGGFCNCPGCSFISFLGSTPSILLPQLSIPWWICGSVVMKASTCSPPSPAFCDILQRRPLRDAAPHSRLFPARLPLSSLSG